MLEQAGEIWTICEAAHLLNRAGFGGSPSQIKALHAVGRTAAVESLISPAEPLDQFPLPKWSTREQAVADMRARAEQFRETKRAMRDSLPEEAAKLKREAQQQFNKISRQHALEAQGWWFRRMLMTHAPLREKMTLFWHDHFATSIQKVKLPALMMFQNELFRRNAFGSSKKMTQTILLDPAMMLYLDTQNSKKGKPNENFAREVMELFTLGEGSYSEQDIREAARAFTGYQINRTDGTVFHNKRQWDSDDKTVFGETGAYDGKAMIDLIFKKQEAARFMSKKIWEFFVADNPPAATIDSLAETFTRGNFEITPLLREIFRSKEFYSPSVMRAQIKSPIQYLIALLKELEITTPPTGFPITAQLQLGQILFMPPNVAGWDWGQAWINTNTLLTRYNLAGFLTKGASMDKSTLADSNGKVPGMAKVPNRMARAWEGPDYEKIVPHALRDDPSQMVDSLIQRFFHNPLPDKARASFIEYANSKKGKIFTNKETAELCHLILSTPYYQLC